jgi:hypothetical protein
MRTSSCPDLLARPLAEAIQLAHQAGWQVEIVKAEPFFHRNSLVWHDENAYVIKQSVRPGHILTLIVGCQFEGRCTVNGT